MIRTLVVIATFVACTPSYAAQCPGQAPTPEVLDPITQGIACDLLAAEQKARAAASELCSIEQADGTIAMVGPDGTGVVLAPASPDERLALLSQVKQCHPH